MDKYISDLRIYKEDGEYLQWTVGDDTTEGEIEKIERCAVSGWFRISYDSGSVCTVFTNKIFTELTKIKK